MDTFGNIIALLDEHAIAFEFLPHASEGRTELASHIRGHALEDAAKSMLVKVRKTKSHATDAIYCLAVVTGDCLVNFKAVAKLYGGYDARLADAEDLKRLTGCYPGAVPPFAFHPELNVLVDERLGKRSRIVFNAGRLDRSISISTDLYCGKFQYPMADISKESIG